MGLPLGLYTHHYGKGCGKQGRGGGKKCQYHGVNQVSRTGLCFFDFEDSVDETNW